MGQAKRRGMLEQRIAQSKEEEALKNERYRQEKILRMQERDAESKRLEHNKKKDQDEISQSKNEEATSPESKENQSYTKPVGTSSRGFGRSPAFLTALLLAASYGSIGAPPLDFRSNSTSKGKK